MNEKKRVISYSACAYYLEAFFNETRLSNATCFIVKGKKCDFLISNWHVFAGKDCDNEELLDKNGSIPNSIRVDLPLDMGNNKIGWLKDFAKFNLLNDDWSPRYLQRRINGKIIDIAALPIQKMDGRYFTIDMGEEIGNENTEFYIGDFVYVLGFPFGRIADYKFPIWKKASVASEPVFDINKLPYFFVDTATRKGMSGSPVIFYEKRRIGEIDKFVNGQPLNISNHFTKFIGVYSGRFPKDNGEGDAQLGRVWKANELYSMINEYEN